MIRLRGPVTVDTNVAVYALLNEANAEAASAALAASSFLSAQVLNEYANVAARKLRRTWREIVGDVSAIRDAVPAILPLNEEANSDALRIAARYKLSFYDALMLAVALSGGAGTFYSEDMQHDLVIDGKLRIVNPFAPGASTI